MDSMITGFKFVFESAGGGITPENVAAQTGDWLSILLTVLFLIVAATSFAFVFAKLKRSSNMRSSSSHATAKVQPQARLIAITVLAVLALAGAVVSAVNTPAAKAFANANGVDYKDAITVTVHESDQSITFEDNFFKNNDADPIHIDHSSLTLSDEAKAILGDEEFYFEAKYIGEETRVFEGESDDIEDCLPVDQTALNQGQTQNVEYNTNITYDIAKKLCDIENAFSLELVPEICYTVEFSANGADSGEPPHSQTITVSSEAGKQLEIEAPDNTGNLAKEGYEFIGWNTKPFGETGGIHIDVGQKISNPKNESFNLYPDWKKTGVYSLSFEAEEGGTVSRTTLDVAPDTVIKLTTQTQETQTIYFGETLLDTNSVVATSTTGYDFVAWEAYEDGQKVDPFPTTVTAALTFKATFTPEKYTLSFEGETDKGGVSTPSLENIEYGTKIQVIGNDIVFGESKGSDNYVSPVPETKFDFSEWKYVKDGSEISLPETVSGVMKFRAKFTKKTVDVSFAVDTKGHGTIDDKGLTKVEVDTPYSIDADGNITFDMPAPAEDVVVTVVPDRTYGCTKWTANGTEASLGSSGIVDVKTDFVTSYEQNKFAIDFTCDESKGYLVTTPEGLNDIPKTAKYTVASQGISKGVLVFKWKDATGASRTATVQAFGTEAVYALQSWTITSESETEPITPDEDWSLPGDCSFNAVIDEAQVTVTYKVVDVNHGHANVALNSDLNNNESNENVFSVTETYPVRQAPSYQLKGATATPLEIFYSEKYNYKYEFINWTKEGTDITYDTASFVPNKEKEGVTAWDKDVTYVCHVAAPRAVYSEKANGEKLMNFVYDEELHSEAYRFNESERYIFPVNNSHFDDSTGNIVFPSWYYDMYTPAVYPTRVTFDKSFKNYKGLTSTSMWFMDSAAIAVMMSMNKTTLNNNVYGEKHLSIDKVSGSAISLTPRAIKSIENLSNIYTDNITESALMFAAGYSMEDSSVIDGLKSLDLSSWGTAKIKDSMAGMFLGCTSLKDLKFPSTGSGSTSVFGSECKDMRLLFAYDVLMSSFPIGGNFGAECTNLNYAFAYCTGLKEINLNSDSTKLGTNVTNIAGTFAMCTALKKIDMSNIAHDKFSKQEEVEACFQGCTEIVKFVLEPNWNIPMKALSFAVIRGDGKWYQYVGGAEEYKEWKESDIASKSFGGTFTRDTAKAIYSEANEEMVFYFDHEDHPEGQEFTIGAAQGKRATGSLFPSWYTSAIYIDGQEMSLTILMNAGEEILINKKLYTEVECLVPKAKTIKFSLSFKEAENISNFNCWFAGDSNGVQPYQTFKSETSQGTWEDGFRNLNTSFASTVYGMFGGFSFESYFSMQSVSRNMPDANLESGDTYGRGLTNISLVNFDLVQNISNYSGMFANATALETVDLGTNIRIGNARNLFSNCSSLKTINNLGQLSANNPYYLSKLFYGCSSLETLDLTSFNTSMFDPEYNSDYFSMLAGCTSLKLLLIGDGWTLPMEQCGLPDWSTGNASWVYQDGQGGRNVKVKDIPFDNGNYNGTKKTGRYEILNTKKTASIEFGTSPADGSQGTITPPAEEAKFSINSSIKYRTFENKLYFSDKVITATPKEGYVFKYWSVNGKKIKDSLFFSNLNTCEFVADSTVNFVAVFGDQGITAKAIYKEGVEINGEISNTMTFVYDNKTYVVGQDNIVEVFDVATDTGYSMFDMRGDVYPLSAKYPQWLGGSYSLNLNTYEIKFTSEALTDAKYVIFADSFKNFDELTSISMWFMADENRYQPFEKFYSPGADGVISDAVEGFANLNTKNISDVAYAFGGAFSAPIFSRLGMPISADIYNNPYDTYGASITKLDMTKFDFSNLTNCQGMFANCIGLQQIIFSDDVDTSNVTNMEAMFANCETLGLIDDTIDPIVNIDKFVTDNVEMMNYMFYGDCGLSKIDFSHWNTEKVFTYEKGFNAEYMFTQCYRLNELKLNTEYAGSLDSIPLKGWTLNLGENFAGMEDTNLWSFVDEEPPIENLYSYQVPYNIMSEEPTEEALQIHSGTFKREPMVDYKITFKTSDPTLGTVNGKESVSYKYIKDATVTHDPDKPEIMIVDNYKVLAETLPQSGPGNSYFINWKYGEGFPEDMKGKAVPANFDYKFLASDLLEGHELCFEAYFSQSSFTPKAVFEFNYQGSTKQCKLTFVYNDLEYDDPDKYLVFPLNTFTSNEYKLPAWYTDLGTRFVAGDNHPVPQFNKNIDNGVIEEIFIEFDPSFVNYDGLTSMSCWFMPAISRKTVSKSFNPFKFDSEHFKGLQYINTTNLTNVSYMFGGSEYTNDNHGSKIKEINLTGFDTGVPDSNGEYIYQPNSLTSIAGLFANCGYLETIEFGRETSNPFGSNVTNMSKTFFNCKNFVGDKLKDILSKMSLGKVTDMSYMLSRYRYPDLIVVPEDNITFNFPDNFNVSNLQTIEGMFSNLQDTKKITITGGINVQELALQNASHLFDNCEKLETVDIDNCKWLITTGCRDVSYMFHNCAKLNDVRFLGKKFEDENPYAILAFARAIYVNNLFENCSSLETFEPENFQIGATRGNADAMFKNSGLKSLYASDGHYGVMFDVFSPASMNEMFYNCQNLEGVNLKLKRPMSTGTTAVNAFAECPKLTYVNLSCFRFAPADSRAGIIPYNMFYLSHEDPSLDTLGNEVIEWIGIDSDWQYINWLKTGLKVYNEYSGGGSKPIREDIYWHCLNDPYLNDVSLYNFPEYYDQMHGWVLGSGLWTKQTPKTVSLNVNKESWGAMVDVGAHSGEMYNYEVRFMNDINVWTNEEKTELHFETYDTDPSFGLQRTGVIAAAPYDSDIANWTYNTGGDDVVIGTEKVQLSSAANISLNFANGPHPQASYNSNSKTLTIMLSNYQPTETLWNINDDGDISTGQPWEDYAEEIEHINFSAGHYRDFVHYDNWFKGLVSLQDFNGNINISKAESMDSMFEGCTSLWSVTLSASYSNVPSISLKNLFKDCSSLQFLRTNLGARYHDYEVNYENMLLNCSSLDLIDTYTYEGSKIDYSKCGLPTNKEWLVSDTYTDPYIYDLRRYTTSELTNRIGSRLMASPSEDFIVRTSNPELGLIGQVDNIYVESVNVGLMNPENDWTTEIYAGSERSSIEIRRPIDSFKQEYYRFSINFYAQPNDGKMFDSWSLNGTALSDRWYYIDPDSELVANWDVRKVTQAVLSHDEELYGDVLTLRYVEEGTDCDENEDILPYCPGGQNGDWYNEYSPWYEYKNNIKKVVIDESFSNVRNLTQIKYWFYEFYNLKYVDNFEYLNPGKLHHYDYAFYNCSSLLYVGKVPTNDITNWRDDLYTSYMFRNCSSLKEVDLSNLSFTWANIECMFENCNSLSSIIFGSGWNQNQWANNWTFQTMKLPKTDEDGNTNYWCDSLFNNYELDQAPNNYYYGSGFGQYWRNSKILSISCDSEKGEVSSSSLPLIDVDSVQLTWDENTNDINVSYSTSNDVIGTNTIRAIFNYSTNPENNYEFDYWKLNGEQMVAGQAYTINPDAENSLYAEFKYSTKQAKAVYVEGTGDYSDTGYFTFYYDVPSKIPEGTYTFDIPTDYYFIEYWSTTPWWNMLRERGYAQQDKVVVDFDESLKNFKALQGISWWFYDQDKITEVKNVKNICGDNIIDCSSAFYYCRNLESIDLSDAHFDNPGMKQNSDRGIARLLGYCGNLKTVNMDNFSAKYATNCETMFYSCMSLETIDLSAFDTTNIIRYSDMFNNCQNLKSIKLRDDDGNTSWNTHSGTSFYSMFNSCYNLETIDTTVFDFNPNSDIWIEYMFYNCYKLQILDFSECDSSSISHNIDHYACMFTGIKSIKTFISGPKWKIPLRSAGFDMYWIDENGLIYDGVKPTTENTYTAAGVVYVNSSDIDAGTIDNNIPTVFSTKTEYAKYEINDKTLTVNVYSKDGDKLLRTSTYNTESTHLIPTTSFGSWTTNPEIEPGANIYETIYITANYADSKTAGAWYTYNDHDGGTLTFAYDTEHHDGEKLNIPKDIPMESAEHPSPQFDVPWYQDQYRGNIRHVVFDESMKDFYGIKTLNCWFYEMYDFDVTGLENIDMRNCKEMFSTFNFARFHDVDFSKLDTSMVETMDHLFYYANPSNISFVDDSGNSSFKTNNVRDFGYMFWGTSVEEINVPNITFGPKLESVYDMFFANGSQRKINISGINLTTSMDRWGLGLYEMFYSMGSLEEITIGPGFQVSFSNIGLTTSSYWHNGTYNYYYEDIPDSDFAGTYLKGESPDLNVSIYNGQSNSQINPEVTPTPAEPEENPGVEGAAAALLAAAPAFAFFGMRKRLRGKHAKLK